MPEKRTKSPNKKRLYNRMDPLSEVNANTVHGSDRGVQTEWEEKTIQRENGQANCVFYFLELRFEV